MSFRIIVIIASMAAAANAVARPVLAQGTDAAPPQGPAAPAQTPAPAAPPTAAPQPAPAQAAPQTVTPVTAGWQDGFVIQSANSDYRLVLGLTAQTDGRFALGEQQILTDTFTIRKARPTVSGRIGKYFDFKVMPDFGNGTAVVQDAYFDIRFSPAFRVRSGKDKTPVGYELLQSDPYLLFPERSLVSVLVPNRDVGIQAIGDLAGGRLSYSAGVFNGVPDAASSTTDVDTNSSKDVAGRVVWQPFRTGRAAALKGFGVHVGGSSGTQSGPLPSFRTSVQQTLFTYLPTTTANGTRTRVSPAVFYYYKALGAFAEYARSGQTLSRTGADIDVANDAWGVTGSFVLTGEAASDRGVRPNASFDPANNKWGALQLVARYSTLTLDRRIFDDGLAAATASREARQFTIGANWYPTAYIKYYATIERTTFAGGNASRAAENVIVFRTQVAF